MSTVIQIKRSTGVSAPTTSDLVKENLPIQWMHPIVVLVQFFM